MRSTSKKYYDPVQQESDQKDLIISQLKAELFELRRNEKDYEELHAKLNNLEHRYNLLLEEKALNERDFKTRQEITNRNITNLKQDIDKLRDEYEAICDDIHSLRLENNNISDVVMARNSEISRLKNELGEVYNENERVDSDKREFQVLTGKLREENRQNAKKLEDLMSTAEELTEKKGRLEKYLKELEYDKSRLEKQQLDLSKQQDSLRTELKNKNESIRYTESGTNNNKKHIFDLEADLKELKKISERMKNDIQNTQKNQSNEFNKNLESQNRINKLEDTIKELEAELNDLKKHYEDLTNEHNNALDVNDDLVHDIDQTTKHLDLLTIQNNELINELEKYNEQDEKVRSILNRKEQILEVKQKTEGKMKSSYYNMSSSLRSPQRKSKN